MVKQRRRFRSPAAVRQAFFDVLNVAAKHETTGAELKLALGALIPHVVALVRALEFNFAGRGERESLRGGFLGFLFRHGLPSSPSGYTRRARTFL